MIRASVLIALAIFFSFSSVTAQKKTPREISGEDLQRLITNMHSYNKIKKAKKPPCKEKALFKSIKFKDLAPTAKEATAIVNRIMDSVTSVGKSNYLRQRDLQEALKAKSIDSFIKETIGRSVDKIDPDKLKTYKGFYSRIQKFKTKGFLVHSKTINRSRCKVTLKVNMRLDSTTLGYKKNRYYALTAYWNISSDVVFDCDCNEKIKHRVKYASYEFKNPVIGPLVFERKYVNYKGETVTMNQFGFRFEAQKNVSGVRTKVSCCTKDDNSEDGSYTDPNEPINYNTPFVNTGIGIGFVNDADTQIVGNAGVLFPIASIGENPLFLGGQIGVQSSSISSDFPVNEYRIGPILEYDHQLNDKGLEWVSGIHTGYLFGSEDFGGADQDFNGFFANLYTGLDIPLGENLSLALLTSFLEYQNLSFDFGEETVTDSFGPSFDRINLTAGLRFNFGNQP